MSNSVTQWTADHQAPLSMELSRQEHWSRLSFPSLGDLPDPGIEPTSLTSPALAGGFFTTGPPIFKLLLRFGYEKEFMNFPKETN